MNTRSPKSTSNSKFFNYLLASWPVVLLTPLIPFPVPTVLTGHPWKAELSLSLILILSLGCLLFRQNRKNISTVTGIPAFLRIIVPILLLVAWSGFSILWAGSINSVLHHTLVWAAYLIFFQFALFIVSDARLLSRTFFVLGAVTAILCINCIVEYLFRENLGPTFGFRYGRFAETWAALLPLFLSFSLRLKGKHLVWTGATTSAVWFALLFANSRASFASAVVGLIVFALLRVFANTERRDNKLLVLGVAWLILLGIVSQIPALVTGEAKRSPIVSRVVTSSQSDPSNSLGQNIRFLFAKVGVEMFRRNPIVGVGADNYGLEFNKYREIISTQPENAVLVKGNEDAIPERAHNEYLQIVAELGIVGGLIFLVFLIFLFRLSLTEVKNKITSPDNILTHAAVAGIVAFLLSSGFSSFSFRLVQNGIVFFFLLALLMRNGVLQATRSEKYRILPANRSKTAVLIVSMLFCLGLATYSTLKAAGQYLVWNAEHTQDYSTAVADYDMAIKLDPANPASNFSLGSILLNRHQFNEAAVEYRKSIEKGVNTSASYSYLISAYTLAGDRESALAAAYEAVRIFPYSTFLRTRYAVLLADVGQTVEADKQFAIAKSIDEKQAETWRILITQGTSKAADATRAGIGVSKLDDLYPATGLYAVIDERTLRFPKEKFQFPPQ